MGLFNFSFLGAKESADSEIPEIFPLALRVDFFIKADILTTYLKILTDTMERTHGLPDALHPLLWDSCVQSDSGDGLISLLAKAMTEKSELFLVFKPSIAILRPATPDEERIIRADYKKDGESSTGVFVSFKKYRRTEMLEVYSAFEYCVLASLNKGLNLAKAVQFKVKDLRGSVGLSDSAVAKAQAKSIAQGLRNGNDVLLDAGDTVETAKIDMEPTDKAIGFLNGKKAYVLDAPLSYIAGEQTAGIGSTGEADMRAVERCLKQYHVSILRPVLDAVFGVETEFKSQDFRQMTTALETLKTFDLVSEENLSSEAKQEIIARVFDLDAEKEKKALELDAAAAAKEPPPAPPVPPVVA